MFVQMDQIIFTDQNTNNKLQIALKVSGIKEDEGSGNQL